MHFATTLEAGILLEDFYTFAIYQDHLDAAEDNATTDVAHALYGFKWREGVHCAKRYM